MVDYTYTTVPGKIKTMLDKVRSVGIPQKVTTHWLKSIGFTSSNDSTLPGVLKFINFTDQNGVPTPTWNSYRGRDHKAVLGKAIRNGYAELYAVYPDAHVRPTAELIHVFNTSSSAGAQVVSKTVATFKALADEAEFPETNETTAPILHSGPLHTPVASAMHETSRQIQAQGGPALHIDIQIHISPESSTEQIEKIFESMAKHLYGRRNE
jgi:hypothetical protein